MALDNNTVVNYTDKTTIKNWFKTGLKPTQTQFWSTWDSFWHKSESLPISSISGLGNLLDGKAETEHTHTEYATNDAASLTAQNITQWQNKLGINDLDYVVIPTEDATVESHPYVVVIDDEGKSAKRNATDFGKVDTIDGIEADENKDVKLGAVRKSESNEVEAGFDLHQKDGASIGVDANGLKVYKGGITATFGTTSIYVDNLVPDAAYKFQEILFPKRAVKNVEEKVYPVTYIQGVKADETGRVDISGIAWNYTSPSIRYSGIVDKSADATFNALMGLDSNGYLGKITQLANLLEKTLQSTTPEQATRIGQLLNGGAGDLGAMNVAVINPPLVAAGKDEIVYITFRGANLKMDVTNYSIQITKNDVIVATIPNNQIVVNSSSTSLTFFYNFKDFDEGDYGFIINNGVKILHVLPKLKIKIGLNYINLNTLEWQVYQEDASLSKVTATGAVVSIEPLIAQNSSNYITAVKSSEFANTGESFLIEFTIKTTKKSTSATGFRQVLDQIIGISYSDINLNLIPNYLTAFRYRKDPTYVGNFYRLYKDFFSTGEIGVGVNQNVDMRFTLLKEGNFIQCVNNTTGTVTNGTVINNKGYSIVLYSPIHDEMDVISLSIQQAYKF